MTVKGYYPSMSLGFGILFSVINMLAGTAFVVVGIMLIFSKGTALVGLMYLGIGAIPAGILAIATGALVMTASCHESVSTMKVASTLAIVALLAGGGIAGYAFFLSKNLPTNARKAFLNLDDEQKKTIEVQYGCCGYTDVKEGSEGCSSEQTCSDPIVEDQGAWLKVTVIVAAVAAGIQLFQLCCGMIVSGKMRTQQEKKMRKAKLSLVEEAQGGYKGKDKAKGKKKEKPKFAGRPKG